MKTNYKYLQLLLMGCFIFFLLSGCSAKQNKSANRWPEVSSISEFKTQFQGTTWTCSNSGYSQKFVVDGNRIHMYLKINAPNAGWSKECDCTYEIYESGGGLWDDPEIIVHLDDASDSSNSKGSLHFETNGTPKQFVSMGDGKGYLHLE